jgi:HD superfamily phosphohydrolase
VRSNGERRDPIRDLIIFREDNETDQIARRPVNTLEFQRLRPIRQLGFSHFV